MLLFISKDIKSDYLSPPKNMNKITLKEIYIALKGTLKKISDRVLFLKEDQIKQFNIKLPKEFSLDELKNHKKDSIKIIIGNGFGNGYGDMLVGSIALENLYKFLKKKYKYVFIDFLVLPEYLGRYFEVFKLNPYINDIYPVINLEKYIEYDFYIDNQGFIYDKEFEEINFIDFFLKKVGLNPNDNWINKKLKLYPNPKVIEEVKEFKETLNFPNKPVLLINFFATLLRHFPEHKWEEIINGFKDEYNIILISDKRNKEKLEKFFIKISKQIKNLYNLSDISSKGFDYLIALIKEIPDVVLTPDTSLTHICAGLNKPCVTVFFSIPPELRVKYYKTVVPYSPDFLRNSKFWKKSKLKKEERTDIDKDREFLELWEKIDINEISNLVKKVLDNNHKLKPNIPENIYINNNKLPKILIYTNKNSINYKITNMFFHLFTPFNFEIKISNIVPLEFNNLTKYDLVVIGTGEFLKKSIFEQPDFKDYLYGAQKTIGIFELPQEDLKNDIKSFIQNLDYWFVLTKKTYSNLHLKNLEYLGFWQILAFPYTIWEIDRQIKIKRESKITNEILIETIQKYRRVYSEQLLPLISGVNSAEYIQYEENPYENIKEFLIDILGKKVVFSKEIKIDRKKVLDYRNKVYKNMQNLKQKIEELV